MADDAGAINRKTGNIRYAPADKVTVVPLAEFIGAE